MDFRFLPFFNAFAPFFVVSTILFHLSYFGQIARVQKEFFCPNLNEFLSELREMIKNWKIFMRVTQEVQYFLEIYEIFGQFQILMEDFIFG